MPTPINPLHFDGSKLTIEQICRLAHQEYSVVLSEDAGFVARIEKGAAFVDNLLNQEGYVYGVTTGFGDSCLVPVPADQVEMLARNLYTFHGCGMGAYFDVIETRAILAARLASLCRGYSGVRYRLLQQLANLLAFDILPLIPQEGSVGASGDLTPLSYVAAVLAGEREVNHQGETKPAQSALKMVGMLPLALKPKEGLAIMNGTAVMTGLACLAFARAAYLSQLTTRITGLMVIALSGNPGHFDAALFAVKPHPGQNITATRIRTDLALYTSAERMEPRLQDRYSLRCAPHVIGVLEDALPWFRQYIETELNSANDNPIIDPDQGLLLHGGHFYGGHIAFAMDSLKNAVANLADLMDRQMAQLMDPKFNHGLPANLSGANGGAVAVSHGFKAVQIAVSAWTAEALKLTLPASIFSRSTECHNQDKVSMGTIASRDCLRVLELTEQVAAAALLAAVQGVELRALDGIVGEALTRTIAEVRQISSPLQLDRALEADLRNCVAAIQQQRFQLYD